jgi:hypothetical protein
MTSNLNEFENASKDFMSNFFKKDLEKKSVSWENLDEV